jgi:hypothetical protein
MSLHRAVWILIALLAWKPTGRDAAAAAAPDRTGIAIGLK